ncbi:hypothetical protein C0995_011693 [Termitomyces sp. Mi166|nr:hypothetical protein C0995_011693 [Termitomyces sp. Mi166\
MSMATLTGLQDIALDKAYLSKLPLMWAKLTSVLKPRAAQDDHDPSLSSPPQPADGGMSKVFEQHSDLSVSNNKLERISSPSPPPSPTRSNRRSMFKRLSRAPFKDDSDSVQAPSPSVGQTKTKGLFGNGNNSQASLSKLTAEFSISSPGRKSSFDTLRPSIDLDARQNATVGAGTSQRRPSLDILRSNEDASPEASPMTPSGFGSVRSILRDPKTPGTGQNVRFFSRDAYKVISPNQSTETEFQSIIPSSLEPSPSAASQEPLFDRRFMPSGTFPVTRASTNDKAVRPSVAEVFSPMSSSDTPPPKEQVQFFESTNLMSPIPPPNFNDLDIDLPKVPPGLGFDVPEPSLDNVIDASVTDDNHSNHDEDLKPSGVATSTPIRDKGKGRVIDAAPNSVQVPDPASVDENIFHSQDKSTQIRPGLHDHSNSFSFGQTVFHSINAASPVAGVSSDSSAPDLKASLFDKDSTDLSALTSQSQNCVLNDTVFQSMMESPAKAPEADINDEYLVVYSNPEPPDPFRANATTYYTPQTMIPVTPPQGAPKHVRKTSKEENIIFSLQTQLALQTELCQQYENDLRSRDELVEILGKKLGDVEKEDLKRRSVLKTWKKKVQELERTCRYLEEEVEGSRQSSMERSIMDEASGEALRMLHRQISVLEKEKDEWVRKEEILREEIGTLEGIVKERNEDVEKLQDSLRSRDESDRESQGGIREVKEQTEHVGDVTRALIDEELEKFMVETQLKDEEERERYRSAESEWEEEKTAIVGKLQYLEAEKSNLEADLGNTKLRLEARDEEYRVLKAELDAQWERTEKTSEEVAELKEKIATLEEERGALNRDIEEFRHKMATMETEANGNEAKKAELEVQLQKVWGHKEELEREKAELEDQLHQERDHSDDLSCALQEQADRISQLDQEHQSSQENVSRLEEKLRQRDEEEKDYSQQIKQREAEAKELREEMSNLRVEHTRTLDELKRTLEEVSLQESTARAQVENLARQQATFDEVKSSADKISALKEEVERQRRRIQLLQQESADKEVKLVQLTKQHQRDKEDLEGMNTALDSKQMELELIKRNLGVRGTAGATPAPASRVTTSRRDSAIFSTPTVSRPPSSASEAGSITSKKRSSVEPSSAIKVTALGQSARSNVAPGISGSKRIEGSMGPPPPKVRPSIAGAVTSASTARVPSLSRSSSAKPSSVSSSVSVRRVASLEQSQSQVKTKSTLRQTVSPSPVPSLSEQEKENVNTSSKGATKRTLVPTPA